MEENLTKVLSICSNGTEQHPMSVEFIGRCIDVSAANVRKYVAELRERGYRICSVEKGYWLAKTDEEYLSFRNHYMGKINKRLRRLKAMDLRVPAQTEMEI